MHGDKISLMSTSVSVGAGGHSAMLDLGKGLEVLVHCSRNGEMFAAVRTKTDGQSEKTPRPFDLQISFSF